MTSFFSADFHFDHKNIIRFSKRPFENIDRMNETIIENWNSKVSQDDTAWFLGDFSFGDKSKAQNHLNRLNGTKHLIIGNHDKTGILLSGWNSISNFKEIKVDGQDIALCHYAMRVWNKSHYGSWMLYGHSHGSLTDDPNALSIDVGVDCHDFLPLSTADIRRIMNKKTWKPIDHHGVKDA